MEDNAITNKAMSTSLNQVAKIFYIGALLVTKSIHINIKQFVIFSSDSIICIGTPTIKYIDVVAREFIIKH